MDFFLGERCIIHGRDGLSIIPKFVRKCPLVPTVSPNSRHPEGEKLPNCPSVKSLSTSGIALLFIPVTSRF
jgi:hypothetical protein